MMSATATRLWIAGIAILLACAACGFKGPLYLPEKNATVVTHPGQTSAAKSKNKTSQPSQPPSPPPTSPPSSAPSSPQ
jgi:predicted small lipoprotein YifL